MANYMEQVAHMLGVELEEEFKLKDGIFKFAQDDTAKISKDEIFKITKDGIYGMFKYNEYSCDWNPAYHLLTGILLGRYEIVKKPILDESEKGYLSEIIKPFRKQVIGIYKLDTENYECIVIKYRNISGYTMTMCFPDFKKGTMYKGMEAEKRYSLNDLGL